MPETKAADLPDGSVVVDDQRGLAWYAGPQYSDARWIVTGIGHLNPVTDHEVDGAMAYGAEVLRYGDGVPVETRIKWAAETTYNDGTLKHWPATDLAHAILIADSTADHLSTYTTASRRMKGVRSVGVVRREVRVFTDGTQVISPWRHACANCDGIAPETCMFAESAPAEAPEG
jgi:hypothetical protein